MNSRNDMKLIMENWRRFEDQIKLDNDFQLLKETKMYVRNGKKQIIESKDRKQYKEVMSFGDYILALENKKLSFKEAEQIYFDTIDYEGSLLNEVSLSGVGQAIKGGIQQGVEKVKQVGQVAGQIGSAVIKGIIDFAKKIFFGALSLFGSIILKAWQAIKNPRTAFAAVKKGGSWSSIASIFKELLPKIVQYIKDNKWKILCTVAVTALLITGAMLYLNMAWAVAYPAVRAITSCGQAAVNVGTAAAKTGKALMAAKAAGAGLAGGAAAGATAATAGALQKEEIDGMAGGVCKLVGGVAVDSIQQILKDTQAIDSLIGAMNESGKTLQSVTKMVNAQSQTATQDGLAAASDERSLEILSGKAEAARVKAIAILNAAKSQDWDMNYLQEEIMGDPEVQNQINNALNLVLKSGCTDPEKLAFFQQIGSHTVVKQALNVKSETVIETLQNNAGFFESIKQHVESTMTTTVSMAAP